MSYKVSANSYWLVAFKDPFVFVPLERRWKKSFRNSFKMVADIEAKGNPTKFSFPCNDSCFGGEESF